MEIDELEASLVQALDEAIAQGYVIVNDSWGGEDPKKSCCAAGALALKEKDDTTCFLVGIPQRFHQRFNSVENFWAFVKGFGPLYKSEFIDEANSYIVLGRKLAAKFNPKSYKDV